MRGTNQFEIQCEANVKKVELVWRLKKSQVIRRVRMRLERQYDALIAAAFGKEAMALRLALETKAVEKVTLPIDAVYGKAHLDAGNEKITIPECRGRKAYLSAGKDDEPPSVVMEFEFLYEPKVWLWFGNNVGGYATIDIGPVQTDLLKKAS